MDVETPEFQSSFLAPNPAFFSNYALLPHLKKKKKSEAFVICSNCVASHAFIHLLQNSLIQSK